MAKRKPQKFDDLRKLPENSKKKPLSKESKRLLAYMLINTVVLMTVYFYAVSLEIIAVMFLYMALVVILGLAFVIYNRGFSRKDVTEAMLPSEWSAEKKREFIEDGKIRLHKSRWMLTLILPLILSLAADFIMIQTIPYLRGLFNI